MTREEALNIIEKESLTCYSWRGKEILYFDSEEEALDDFIRRLKLTKREIDCGLEERRKKELARETEGETQDHD